MKKFGLLASAGMIMASANVLAADLPRRTAAPVAPAAKAYSWTGFYAGVNGGYAWSHQTHRQSDNVIFSEGVSLVGPILSEGFVAREFASKSGGFTFGGQAGYNHQVDRLIFGIEADFNKSSVSARNGLSAIGTEGIGGPSSYYFFADSEAKSSIKWFSTLRARVGFTPVDRFMIFATGGLAYGSMKTTAYSGAEGGFGDCSSSTDAYSCGSYYGETSKSYNKLGFAVGGGFEYALTNNISVKTEYLYVDLGKKTLALNGGGSYSTSDGATPTPATTSGTFEGEIGTVRATNKFSVMRVGLNYKF
jgi:outer membrane immunogenic protein